MARITVLGEVVLDRILNNGEIRQVAGGSAANCALGLVKIGHDVSFRARFSVDPNGEFLYQNALANGLNLESSIRANQPATVVEVTVNETGLPTYEFILDGTADWQWTLAELTLKSLQDQEAFVYGSLAAILDPAYSTLREWLKQNRRSDLIIAYDPNARPSAIEPKSENIYRERILKLVETATLVKVSDEDLNWIEPNQDPISAAKRWSQIGPQLVVLTLGANGAQAFRHGQCVAQIAGVKTQIVDTVGAGDTLMAWLVSGMIELDPLRTYKSEIIREVLRKAVIAAAINCERQGCNPPSRQEVS